MANFNERNQQSIAEFILKSLPRHEQFALATIDDGGNPWVVCLNLSFDKNINIIWKSLASTEHSKHIALRPTVSICVFSHTKEYGDFGFYTKAVAYEITDKAELSACLDVRYKQQGKDVPSLSRFLNGAPERIYIAELKEAWVNDDRHIKARVDFVVLRNIANTEVVRKTLTK